MRVTEKQYQEAKELIRLYELQQKNDSINELLPQLEEGMILEYKDLGGYWYEYTKDLQDNPHFTPPLGLRVRKKE